MTALEPAVEPLPPEGAERAVAAASDADAFSPDSAASAANAQRAAAHVESTSTTRASAKNANRARGAETPAYATSTASAESPASTETPASGESTAADVRSLSSAPSRGTAADARSPANAENADAASTTADERAEATSRAAAEATSPATADSSVDIDGAESAASIDSPASAEIVQLANELVGRIWMHMTARAAELNLSVAEVKALQQLDADHPMPMRVLAARVHTNPSNLTVIVGRLEARGLLTRVVSADRRVKGVRLTQPGIELRVRLEQRLLTNHPAVHGLSPAEQRSLLLLLRRLNAPR